MSEVADYKLVRNSSVGAELTEEKAKILAAKLGVRQLQDGELLIKEGEADQTLFLLATGTVTVTSKDADGVDQHVYTMKEGECAGTRAFVEQSPRKATLRAVGETTVYTLTPRDFEALLDENPRLAYLVMRALFRVTHANLARMNQESRELTNYITKTQGRY
ncbi:MAG: cyclic nucleotide-binding domain-containing protein [Nitrosomonadales bacterium]|nr:cyclic nucleotide-binding domain-containing protein [Nitrosomonadales bacterium]